ncbi:flagellar hook capping FlgD N-terminal domain-containing protein [uncultured Intestinimonas sp.]|uniref:flagellar hook assembly protein FlgD n=1 Tax=uncultured Intestinimonas sp. TaxID=1689265 RepID=UPI0025F0B27F|nr:flagellar hook capping FlgD N-terminal domain-containing protein [uncultured Intestinimonas sp.]
MASDFMPQGVENRYYSSTLSGQSAARGLTQEQLDWLDANGVEINQPGEDTGLDFEDYLQLMVQQLQNQTMDNATDTSDMLNQLVQMSVVEMMTKVQTSIDSLVEANTLTYAASLVGKTVTIGVYDDQGNLQELVGEVTGTGTYQGSPVIFVGGEMYALSDIMAVGTLPAVPETPSEGEGGSSGSETETPSTEQS